MKSYLYRHGKYQLVPVSNWWGIVTRMHLVMLLLFLIIVSSHVVCCVDYLSWFLTRTLKNGKVFIFLVKLYKRVFYPNIFNYVVTFLNMWS